MSEFSKHTIKKLHEQAISLGEQAKLIGEIPCSREPCWYFRIPMMKYDIHSQMILRVPRFPVSKASLCLADLLEDPAFRDALYLGSDSIFNELGKNDYQLNNCSDKMKHSLAKYQKRICYRPTPFGGFAGVAVIPLKEADDSGIIVNATSFQTRIIKKEQALIARQHYRVNPFLYPFGSDFRLIAKAAGDKKASFVISEIYGSAVIEKLSSCRGIMSLEDLLEILSNNGIDEEANSVINDLIELQIILPHYSETSSFPCPILPEHKKDKGSSYDSFCSFSADGSLPPGTKQKLQQALACLEKICTSQETDALRQFKSRFEKLFDKREMPLLHALDPEMGIDYDGLANASSPSVTDNNKPQTMAWSPLHELLLRKWTGKVGEGLTELEIFDADLNELDVSPRSDPPGISVIFSVCNDKLYIKGAGGVSSLNMIGRFTVLDPDIRQLARELAVLEMKSNPNVVFAEISHIDSPELASVKNKAVVYDYQIPFFESHEVPDDFVIVLNDLFISLVDNRIILRSARLNKQVLPRFSSAYNYQKSTLPVFRFLCDLQQEGVDANLNFSMQNLFPGLCAYPRVTYKKIILEAASWHVDAENLNALKKLDPAAQLTAFKTFAEELNLPEEFCYEVHDHLLPINRLSDHDISLLLKSIPASGKIIFREYLKSQETLVKDNHGNCYTHECIAFLSNRKGSYVPPIDTISVHKQQFDHKQKLFPFDDWLYLKIYLHPAGYHDLLVNYIVPFISENQDKGNITSWFFVSYYDDDFHLRLRLKQTPELDVQLLKSYQKFECKIRELPNLKRIELSTYFQEHERYTLIGIKPAEEIFEVSSIMVLSGLCQRPLTPYPDREKIYRGVRHLLFVFQCFHLDTYDIEELINRCTFDLSKNERIELDMEFRSMQKDLRKFILQNKENSALEDKYISMLLAATECLKPADKLRVLTDLNHMHLNRHYLVDQRYNEVKTYYFVGKIVKEMRSRLNIKINRPFCFDEP